MGEGEEEALGDFDIGFEVVVETSEMEEVELPSSQPTSEEMDRMVTEATSENTHKATRWGVKKLQIPYGFTSCVNFWTYQV